MRAKHEEPDRRNAVPVHISGLQWKENKLILVVPCLFQRDSLSGIPLSNR